MIINLLIFILIFLLLDIYGFWGLKKRFTRRNLSRKVILRSYWISDLIFAIFAIILIVLIRTSDWPDYVQYRTYFWISGGFILAYMPKLAFIIFNIFDDIYRISLFLIQKILIEKKSIKPRNWILTIGLLFSALIFLLIAQGIFIGKYNFRIKEETVEVENLPRSFNGLKIIHISDTHLGSFARKKPIYRAIEMIREIPHDILVFTGDMVNNEAVEAEKYVEGFSLINSRKGKFSVLGNHDMGDYRRWYTIEEKSANLQQLENIQKDMGYKLLRNQHDFILSGDDSLMIAGVDNWGEPPFARYGDLSEALGERKNFFPTILLTHDPSHWRSEVLDYPNIVLTLSGHTHGMQVGIETPWFRYSPVSIKYPEWGGLYQQDNQFIYVNRGLGFLGFPGRIGMRPEITLLTLKRRIN